MFLKKVVESRTFACSGAVLTESKLCQNIIEKGWKFASVLDRIDPNQTIE